MKLFVTVNMSTYIKEEIMEIMPQLRSNITEGRFVPMDNLHITMLFLGEVDKEKLSLVEKAMDESIKGIEPFVLMIEGLGVFPNEKHPNILWAGVKGDIVVLNKLYGKLLENIRKLGLPHDAKSSYTPHVTLARKIGDGYQKGEISLKSKKWQVDSLELYESLLSKDGIKYQKLFTKKFII